ncbi:MAG: membrane dipeptidase [Arenicella sp.]|jgi:membrane dipeptidase
MISKMPIVDLHCDLLSYLTEIEEADIDNVHDIGCSLPFLKAGNVKMQVLAVYSGTEQGSADYAMAQVPAYEELIKQKPFMPATSFQTAQWLMDSKAVGVVMAIENASGLAEENEPLQKAFDRIDYMLDHVGKLLYMSFTHHWENRFGGGNYSEAGLKPDGEKLLEFIAGKQIAVDLSHSSDALGFGILDYIIKNNLDVPVMASHSNFRTKWNHVRNLTDEMAQEIIRRKGVIGINFLREYVDRKNPNTLLDHIIYGLANGAEDALCFGADYFYVHSIKDPKRIPLFFRQHENATAYHPVLEQLRERGVSTEHLNAISHRNALNFFERLWGHG